VSLFAACASGDSQILAVGDAGITPPVVTVPDRVHVRFDPGDGASLDSMTLGAIPWPDDLYLDRAGRIAVSSFKDVGLDEEQAAEVSTSLAGLDGFGVSSPIFFYLDGQIDAATLPQAEVDSLDAQASVYLIDADTGSPDAFTKVPITVQWQGPRQRLALRPADGHPLTPGRRYAAIVTRRVQDRRARDLEPAPKFAAVRDPAQQLEDPRLVAARAAYTPVFETLARTGVKRDDICALAVFHVQSVDRDLVDARQLIRSGSARLPTFTDPIMGLALDRALGSAPPAAVGLGEVGGVAHDAIAAMVHGTLPSQNLLSANSRLHGVFERDASGQLRVKRMEAVPFTLFVPRKGTRAPIVIYQHQRDRERSDALAIANELAARGIAVLALDAPFQGLRASPPVGSTIVDSRNRFTEEQTPDGFGDAPGDFLGLTEAGDADARWNPLHARDALRQGVVDLMVALRSIEEGAFDRVLASRMFERTRVGVIGEDVGAAMAVLLARFEPLVQALVLASPSGGWLAQWSSSAADQPLFGQLSESFGRPASIDLGFDGPAFWPEAALYQMLLDRGDALAHASALRRAAVNILILVADDDEQVSNRVSEAYAAALGITLVGSRPRYVPSLESEDLTGDGFGGNYAASGNRVTRAMYVYGPATHDFLLHRSGQVNYTHPPEPPFEKLSNPTNVANPTQAAVKQIADYLASCITSEPANAACTAFAATP
jgi:hypothetical protein